MKNLNSKQRLMIAAMFIMFPVSLYANGIGFPLEPQETHQISLSGSGTWGKRDMTRRGSGLIHRTENSGFEFEADYGILENLTAVLQVGAEKLKITDINFNGGMGFAMGIGAKAKLYEAPAGWHFTATGLYHRFSSSDNGVHLVRSEINAALTVTQSIFFLKPYLGVLFTSAKISRDIRYEPEKHVGLLMGLEYQLVPGLTANLETRLVNETVIRAGLTYRFGRTFP